MIDISEDNLKIIKDILFHYVPDCEVRVFGSRVSGNAKKYSDIDLVIKGKQSISRLSMANLRYAFEESNLPFRVDILDWHMLSESFRKTIMKDCRVLSPGSQTR